MRISCILHRFTNLAIFMLVCCSQSWDNILRCNLSFGLMVHFFLSKNVPTLLRNISLLKYPAWPMVEVLLILNLKKVKYCFSRQMKHFEYICIPCFSSTEMCSRKHGYEQCIIIIWTSLWISKQVEKMKADPNIWKCTWKLNVTWTVSALLYFLFIHKCRRHNLNWNECTVLRGHQ